MVVMSNLEDGLIVKFTMVFCIELNKNNTNPHLTMVDLYDLEQLTRLVILELLAGLSVLV